MISQAANVIPLLQGAFPPDVNYVPRVGGTTYTLVLGFNANLGTSTTIAPNTGTDGTVVSYVVRNNYISLTYTTHATSPEQTLNITSYSADNSQHNSQAFLSFVYSVVISGTPTFNSTSTITATFNAPLQAAPIGMLPVLTYASTVSPTVYTFLYTPLSTANQAFTFEIATTLGTLALVSSNQIAAPYTWVNIYNSTMSTNVTTNDTITSSQSSGQASGYWQCPLNSSTGKYYFEVLVKALINPADNFIGFMNLSNLPPNGSCYEPAGYGYVVFFNGDPFFDENYNINNYKSITMTYSNGGTSTSVRAVGCTLCYGIDLSSTTTTTMTLWSYSGSTLLGTASCNSYNWPSANRITPIVVYFSAYNSGTSIQMVTPTHTPAGQGYTTPF